MLTGTCSYNDNKFSSLKINVSPDSPLADKHQLDECNNEYSLLGSNTYRLKNAKNEKEVIMVKKENELRKYHDALVELRNISRGYYCQLIKIKKYLNSLRQEIADVKGDCIYNPSNKPVSTDALLTAEYNPQEMKGLTFNIEKAKQNLGFKNNKNSVQVTNVPCSSQSLDNTFNIEKAKQNLGFKNKNSRSLSNCFEPSYEDRTKLSSPGTPDILIAEKANNYIEETLPKFAKPGTRI